MLCRKKLKDKKKDLGFADDGLQLTKLRNTAQKRTILYTGEGGGRVYLYNF